MEIKHKKESLFETLLNLYFRLEDLKRDNEKWESVRIKLKEWKELPKIVTSIRNYSAFAEEIKEILITFFRADIELTISNVQIEYDDEVESNKRTWNSEFAGDFSKKEDTLSRKLITLKSFIYEHNTDSNK